MIRPTVVGTFGALALLLAQQTLAQARQPTIDEAMQLKTLGINAGMIQKGDTNILFGGCETNPYPILERVKGSGSVQITPSGTAGSLRNGINPGLACRLSKLIQAFAAKGCQIRITSAYRSAQQQQDMCGAGRSGCAPAGRSCHQYGLAVDISSNCTAQLRSYLGTRNSSAPGAQQFKLHFPYYGDHIQCIENAVAACSPSTKPCDGSTPINPDLSTVPSPGALPTSGLADQIRQALGMQQPPSQPLPQTSSAPISQQPLSNEQTPISSYISTTPITATGTIEVASTTPEAHATSTFDEIDQIANPVSESIDIGTPTEIDLNASTTADVIALEGVEMADLHGSTSNPLNPTYSPPHTFVSEDLADSYASPTSDQTFIARFLATMQGILNYASSYLKPFGGRIPGHATVELE
ncbi:MAG: D-alanyl-D-alanine carboxypeptidase [Candidatus Parcubacteria bacterium]